MEKKERNYGADMVKELGTLSQGISKFSKEPDTVELTPLKNRFSALHDVSMKEATRMAKPAYMDNE